MPGVLKSPPRIILNFAEGYFKTLFDPTSNILLKYGAPYLAKDIDLLEAVQRRATKFVSGLENLPMWIG